MREAEEGLGRGAERGLMLEAWDSGPRCPGAKKGSVHGAWQLESWEVTVWVPVPSQ